IVNAAKAAWEVIKDNKPVANAASDFASAVPSGVPFTDLTGWDPNRRSIRWHYEAENLLGVAGATGDVVINWYFNGQYRGHGQFINHATVVVERCDVLLGFQLSAHASIRDPMNEGTTSDPLAALPFEVTLQLAGVLQNTTKSIQGTLL